MTQTRRLNIPNQIVEFDDNMLVPLNRNFDEVQRHVARTQARVESLEEMMDAVIYGLSAIEESLEEILAWIDEQETE